MKILFSSFLVFTTTLLQAQFFVQKLPQDQISWADETYLITNDGDTISGGRISGITSGNFGISKFTYKKGSEKMKFEIGVIQAIHIIPGETSQYQDIALLPIVKNLKNTEFIKVLPEDGLVIYERIALPGRNTRYALAQLLNPGFDSKIKVYAHPDASNDENVTTVNGLMVDGGLDNQHYVSVGGAQTFVLGSFGYRKKSPELLYSSCDVLKNDKKLRWRDFAKHVFTFDQTCE